jgi:hypothetical protein
MFFLRCRSRAGQCAPSFTRRVRASDTRDPARGSSVAMGELEGGREATPSSIRGPGVVPTDRQLREARGRFQVPGNPGPLAPFTYTTDVHADGA